MENRADDARRSRPEQLDQAQAHFGVNVTSAALGHHPPQYHPPPARGDTQTTILKVWGRSVRKLCGGALVPGLEP